MSEIRFRFSGHLNEEVTGRFFGCAKVEFVKSPLFRLRPGKNLRVRTCHSLSSFLKEKERVVVHPESSRPCGFVRRERTLTFYPSLSLL